MGGQRVREGGGEDHGAGAGEGPRRGREPRAQTRGPQLPLSAPAPTAFYNHSSISEIHRLSKERKALWSLSTVSRGLCACLPASVVPGRQQVARDLQEGGPAFCLLREEGCPETGRGPVLSGPSKGPCSGLQL